MGTMVDNPMFDAPIAETGTLFGDCPLEPSEDRAVEGGTLPYGPTAAVVDGLAPMVAAQSDEGMAEGMAVGTPGSVDSFVLAEAFAVADSLGPGSVLKVLCPTPPCHAPRARRHSSCPPP